VGSHRSAGSVLKWIGVAAAILSLIVGIQQLVKAVAESRARRRHAAELVAIATAAQSRGDFHEAWAETDSAARLAGGSREVTAAQEDVTMAWLERMRLTEGQTFSQVVAPLFPILERAALNASGTRKADLLAHIGWADFLRSRDGVGAVTPDADYRRALAVDPTNVYAHAMWGHWILWHGGSVADARPHFTAALATGRDRPFVRRLQVAALEGPDEERELERLRVVNEMRRSGEEIDATTSEALWDVYYDRFEDYENNDSALVPLFAAAPPAEQLVTFRLLFDRADFDESKRWNRDYYMAALEEASGQRVDALRTFESVRRQLPRFVMPAIRGRIDAAITRLSRHP
jgi:hypothetical protein